MAIQLEGILQCQDAILLYHLWCSDKGRSWQHRRLYSQFAGSDMLLSIRHLDTESGDFIGHIRRYQGGRAIVRRQQSGILLEARQDAPLAPYSRRKAKRITTCQQLCLFLTDIQVRHLCTDEIGKNYRILWLTTAYLIRFAIQREVLLIATQPALGIGRPSDIDTVRGSMIATINHGDRTTLFTEVHLTVLAFHVEIAVDEHRPLAKSAPERLLSIKVHLAMAINGRTVHGIIRTLEMAILIIRILSAIEGIEVQTTDETDVFSPHLSAMDIAHMSLGNRLTTFLTGKGRIERIVEVDITVVAHRQVLYREFIAPEVEHGEVADGTLCLASL